MRSMRARALATVAVVVAAACGSSSDGAETPATTSAADTTIAPTTTEAVVETTTTVAGFVPTDFSEVQPAVVQIVAQGTFRDPEIGLSDGSGAGSGFIISPDGLAVTNNHVVAGAATLEVFVGGDDSTGLNATILGVSECNDLALIDISEPEPLPYLEWYDEEIRAGLDVYAAGFPLGDPEFTLTRGIVSKARAGGDLTGTSSIDHTLEHDANIQPGNSGGPLVAPDGRVVGVNYAGGALATTTAQFFAIASDLAVPVIDRLADGDFESIGINGWAVVDEEAGIAGVWVASVSAGSPASRTGILPGDIITSMNGLPVGTDGTFKDYCDVIRTAGDNAIAVEILRFDTSEVLRGEINGPQQLELSFSFADVVEEQTNVGAVGGAPYTSFQRIVDDQGRIVVEAPAEWVDIDTTPFLDDNGTAWPSIRAAPDLNGLDNSFFTPGLWYLLFDNIPPTSMLSLFTAEFDACTPLGVTDYSDAVFTGVYEIYDACQGTDTAILVLAAEPADKSSTALILVQIVNDADLGAVDQIFNTFNTTG